mmetsp:Transcript_25309/g.31188  ORF Transcript_25309/g.31188 Transcript_25309/m.31188 type:complete len:92 (+) Transcript_25309:1063-1338(+)
MAEIVAVVDVSVVDVDVNVDTDVSVDVDVDIVGLSIALKSLVCNVMPMKVMTAASIMGMREGLLLTQASVAGFLMARIADESTNRGKQVVR